jgi:hypothetical protein
MQYRATHFPVTLLYPKGTYRREVFYTRGSDQYREPEWTAEARRVALLNYREARAAYDEIKREHDAIFHDLTETEQYALRLAENLGEGCEATTENHSLRQEIVDLTSQIEHCIAELKALDSTTRPTDCAQLEKEFAAFGPEIDSQVFDADVSRANYLALRTEVCQILASEDFPPAVNSLIERRVAQQCKSDMATRLRHLHKIMDTAPSGNNSKRTASVNAVKDEAIRSLRSEVLELHLESLEVELQKELAKTHRRVATRTLIEQIETMDDVIQLMGVDGMDLEEIKAQVHCDELDREDEEIRQREAEFRQQANDGIGVEKSKGQAGVQRAGPVVVRPPKKSVKS